MKINEYPTIGTLGATDAFVAEAGPAGTVQVKAESMIYGLIDSMGKNGLGLRNRTLRGKDLGTFDASRKAAVDNELFTDMFLGDYWVIDGRKWVIADIGGPNRFGKKKLVLIGDNAGIDSSTNDDNEYSTSAMRTTVQALNPAVTAFFGESNLPTYHQIYRDLSTTKVTVCSGVEMLTFSEVSGMWHLTDNGSSISHNPVLGGIASYGEFLMDYMRTGTPAWGFLADRPSNGKRSLYGFNGVYYLSAESPDQTYPPLPKCVVGS